ncbi:hypothetical protein I79_023117 [Cricetulus griseus]|uniref:Uncharacterized protein n=1 Tax=Cricetulus griseus TaxID=10029 RepID=G3IH37_CRIGR|nr:hypothetical protein I79_023117 [Cricetulus griseus]
MVIHTESPCNKSNCILGYPTDPVSKSRQKNQTRNNSIGIITEIARQHERLLQSCVEETHSFSAVLRHISKALQYEKPNDTLRFS